MKKKLILLSALSIFVLGGILPVEAKPSEYSQIVRHLKTKYRAKKVKIPFLFLARFAVGVVRPAGVKSFGVTMFKGLKFSSESLDAEMQAAMRGSFGPEWTPAFRVRSREGQQAYMYMREDGKNIRIALVTIDKEQAAIIRAVFSPDRLSDFINDPKVLGIRLDDDDQKDRDPDPDVARPASSATAPKEGTR